MITIDFTGDFIKFIADVSMKYNIDYNLAFIKVINVISSLKDSELYKSVLNSFNDDVHS